MSYDADPISRTEKTIIVNEWQAWQKCEDCDEGGTVLPIDDPRVVNVSLFTCTSCSGQGGWWHPKVKEGGWEGRDPVLINKNIPIYLVDAPSPTYEQAKSSILIQSVNEETGEEVWSVE